MLELNIINKIRKVAKEMGWDEICVQESTKMISFKKKDQRVNVYYSTMTVATCLKHPKKGKTQLFRRYVDMDTLKKIFENPRIHTDTGYYNKGG